MSEDAQRASSGPGVIDWLGIVFLVLQLTGYISWSWWLVLAPFWIPVAIYVGCLAFFLVATPIERD